MKFKQAAITLSTVFLLSACATTTTTTIVEADGRVTLAESYIGEDYNAVMTRAAAKYAVEPQCEGRKISLSRKRKAFLYDTCGFIPEKGEFAGAPLAEVVYHFIDRELVRVDIRAEGEAVLFDKIKSDMQSVFANGGAQPAQLREGSLEWAGKQHLAGLRAGGGANAGNVHVRLLDETLKDSAPWLAAE